MILFGIRNDEVGCGGEAEEEVGGKKYKKHNNVWLFKWFLLTLHPKVVRKYAKYSEVWIGLTGIIISSNS